VISKCTSTWVFYDQLKNRFKAPGDFAQAYVIAHEVGHHIQTLVGISSSVQAARKKLSEAEGNKLSVRQELQADCLAGVWAHHANRSRQLLEVGDVEEGLTAASAIGDDTLTETVTRIRQPGLFYPWQFGTTGEMVQNWFGQRRHGQL
jgi:predicted metalloprotease